MVIKAACSGCGKPIEIHFWRWLRYGLLSRDDFLHAPCIYKYLEKELVRAANRRTPSH